MIILNDYKILCGERDTLITKNQFSTKIQENIDGHTLKLAMQRHNDLHIRLASHVIGH